MNSPSADRNGDIEQTSDVNWKLIAAGVVAVLAFIFILQNRTQGTISFLFLDVTMGVWLALLITFVLGIVVGLLVAHVVRRRKKSDAEA